MPSSLSTLISRNYLKTQMNYPRQWETLKGALRSRLIYSAKMRNCEKPACVTAGESFVTDYVKRERNLNPSYSFKRIFTRILFLWNHRDYCWKGVSVVHSSTLWLRLLSATVMLWLLLVRNYYHSAILVVNPLYIYMLRNCGICWI